jgi:hypothetical protein
MKVQDSIEQNLILAKYKINRFLNAVKDPLALFFSSLVPLEIPNNTPLQPLHVCYMLKKFKKTLIFWSVVKSGIKGQKINFDQNIEPWWRVKIDSKKQEKPS